VELPLLITGQGSCCDTVASALTPGFTSFFRIPASAFPRHNKGLELNPCGSRNPPAELQETMLALRVFRGAREGDEHTVQFTLLGFHHETQGNVSGLTSAVTPQNVRPHLLFK